MKCPNCSAELEYSVKDKEVKCEYCGSKFNPEELEKQVKVKSSKKEKEVVEGIEGRVYTCKECGAKLLTFDETAVTFCSYCGSQAILDDELYENINPDYIIPFKITKEEAIKNYIKKVNRSIFAPKYLKSTDIVDKFRGIYMPYAVYKVGYHGTATNKGEVYYKTVGNYQYYHKYSIDNKVDAEYSGITYDLSSKFYDSYSQAVRHDFKEAVEFKHSYLPGFYVDTKDVEIKKYYSDAISEVKPDANSNLSKEKVLKKHGCRSANCPLNILDTEIALFPVYFMSFRDKDGKNMHYAVVNAETGEVTFETPISYIKYILLSLVIALGIFLLIDNITVFSPKSMIIIGIIVSVISMLISNNRLNTIFKRQNFLDDKGLTSEEKKIKTKPMPFKGKFFKYLIKPSIGAFIGLVSLIMPDMVYDLFYYIICMIIFIFVLLSFIDLLNEHNMLCKRKIPQLEKRGGNK